MTKFIELHSFFSNKPILINVDSIAYIDEGIREHGVSVYLKCYTISSRETGGMVSRIDGKLKLIEVAESYAKVKSLIEE